MPKLTFAENFVVRVLFLVQIFHVQEIRRHGLTNEGEQTHEATLRASCVVRSRQRLLEYHLRW